MSMAARYDEQIVLPRAIRFPIELIPPDGFDEERLETWPRVVGRLEYVEGRLLYLPPCGDEQQEVVTDVVITVGAWVRAHREFVLGTNEAGMRLAGMTRAADAAVWRRELLGPRTGGLRRVPPVLAIEVAAQDELEGALEEKARWYLSTISSCRSRTSSQVRELDGGCRSRDFRPSAVLAPDERGERGAPGWSPGVPHPPTLGTNP